MTEPQTPRTKLSPLEQLKADIDAVAFPDWVVKHPLEQMAQYELVFSTNIDGKDVERFRRISKVKARGDEVDAVKFNSIMIAEYCTGIISGGTLLVDGEDDELTFGSDDLMKMLGTKTAADTARAFLKSDLGMGSIVTGLMEKAGLGKEAEEVGDRNPTSRG